MYDITDKPKHGAHLNKVYIKIRQHSAIPMTSMKTLFRPSSVKRYFTDLISEKVFFTFIEEVMADVKGLMSNGLYTCYCHISPGTRALFALSKGKV